MRIPFLNTALIGALALVVAWHQDKLLAPLAPLPSITIKAPPKIAEAIFDAASEHRLDALLLIRLIRQESGFKPTICSSAGACGLTQLMPLTAIEVGVTDRTDVRQSVHGGAQYLRKMIDRYGRTDLGLAAYNCGPKCIDDWRAGKRALPDETRGYVRAILGKELVV